MKKNITIELTDKRRICYEARQYTDQWILYRIEIGWVIISEKRIGESRSLEDAVTLAKCDVNGTIHEVQIH